MTEPGGYVGRFLHVDLSQGKLTDEYPAESLLRTFIGGYGLGARILYEHVPAGADPLGPDNMLGFVTGPLTGTPALMGCRYCVVAKSPLTGGWGDANSGGYFGPALKFAGYDAVFVRGASPQPVYLLIDDGQAELRPADDLWGLDCVETEEALQARHGSDVRVTCIGPAGERLSLISCIINDQGRAAGRSGLGAVMGSKQLKAVVVRGKRTPAVVHPDRVKELRKKYLPRFRTRPAAQIMSRYGSAGETVGLIEIGRTPIKNWRGAYPDDFPNLDAIDGPAMNASEVRKYGCWHCPLVCGGIVQWESDGQVFEGHKPEYETIATFGTYCEIEDAEAITKMNTMCNRAGLDTISAGAAIAFSMECYEQDLLTPDELDGLTLNWGDGEAAIALLQRIVERRGLGNLLADGVWRASQKLGQGSEAFAIHAGGQELPAHDPRQLPYIGFAYQISPTPGRHTQGGAGAANMSPEQRAIYGLDPDLEAEHPIRSHAQAYAALTAWNNVMNAAGLCSCGGYGMGPEHVPEFIAAVTGWDFDMAECLRTGERIEVMRLVFGLREGYNPLHTQVTARAMGRPPLQAGPNAGVMVDVEGLQDAYLEFMEWDPVTATPGRSRLAALGLGDVADNIAAKGE